ncbi:MAG: RluA family pseudouridine synthase [Candidatus Pacebacteria bacterium]|nr:RluA family pseudouridine synthase [Candidatus Paceibacterota bacterium]
MKLIPKIIYQSSDFLILNKPAGMLVHGAREGEEDLTSWLRENYPEVKSVGDDPENRPGIVHRLDRETSGIIFVPRNQKTYEYFKNLFKSHQIEKKYIALVFGEVKDKQGIIEKPIGIKSGTVKRSVHSEKMRKEAITEYKVLKYLELKDKKFTLLEVTPRTGRTHQIRVHLAFIGHPIAGDKLYGGKRGLLEGLDRQFLHAKSLEFTAPDGKRLRFEAELPEELKSLIK